LSEGYWDDNPFDHDIGGPMSLMDDGLITPEVGAWNELKYQLVYTYSDMFTSSMKGKWHSRVYINLFSGAGRSRFRENGLIVESSAIQALRIPQKFDQYIFCDIETEMISALKKRIHVDFPGANAEYIIGDVNRSADEILRKMPPYSKEHKVLAFCFVDPYKMENLAFETIRSLSQRFMDFLILIPTDMDANRNVSSYESSDNNTVSKFLGNPNWRIEWEQMKATGKQFRHFIFDAFSRQMITLKYLPFEPDQSSLLIRNIQKNAPLYRLSFYSRHDIGKILFKEAKKYSDPRMNLFD
jgi:three-Cys-motif partner protein